MSSDKKTSLLEGELLFTWRERQIPEERREFYSLWLNDLQKDMVVTLLETTGVERAISCSIVTRQPGENTCSDMLFGYGKTILANCVDHRPKRQLGDYQKILAALEEVARAVIAEIVDPLIILEVAAGDAAGSFDIPFCWVQVHRLNGVLEITFGGAILEDAPAKPIDDETGSRLFVGILLNHFAPRALSSS